MIKFIVRDIVCLLVGGFIGTMWMAMACIVDDIDEFDEFMQETEPEEHLCPFCGGKLSEVRVDSDGKEYRYCYSCFHEYEVNDNA